MNTKSILLFLGLLLSIPMLYTPAQAERIRDLATVQGVRSNSLMGYGLVVGLDGTGDQTMQAPFTGQSLNNMLSQLGITVPAGTNMQLKNIAAVMVTAELPPFARSGDKIDIVVSSLGNAKSLRGGTLLMTPLKGADNQIYAMAQGNVLISGAGAQAGGSRVQVNQLNGGRISGGATVEREVPNDFATQNTLRLQLNSQISRWRSRSATRLIVAIAVGRQSLKMPVLYVCLHRRMVLPGCVSSPISRIFRCGWGYRMRRSLLTLVPAPW